MNELVCEHTFLSGQRLQIVQGDITQEHVDAIVNAANANLQHGAGVAGAISLKGGPQIQKESDAWLEANGPVAHEAPAYTSGGNLPCKYVIHTVGPVWGEGDEEAKLEKALEGTLKLGDKLGVKSIAIPAISTGIFGFPKALAAKIQIQVFSEFFRDHPDSEIKVVRLTLFDEESVAVFVGEFKSRFSLREMDKDQQPEE